MSASTTGTSLALKRLETVLFPDEIPPVSPTILIFVSCSPVSCLPPPLLTLDFDLIALNSLNVCPRTSRASGVVVS